MQKHVNLVDLVKSFPIPTSIHLLKSAVILTTTNPSMIGDDSIHLFNRLLGYLPARRSAPAAFLRREGRDSHRFFLIRARRFIDGTQRLPTGFRQRSVQLRLQLRGKNKQYLKSPFGYFQRALFKFEKNTRWLEDKHVNYF